MKLWTSSWRGMFPNLHASTEDKNPGCRRRRFEDSIQIEREFDAPRAAAVKLPVIRPDATVIPDLDFFQARFSHRVPAASLLKSLRLHDAVQRAVDTRRATEVSADILDSM